VATPYHRRLAGRVIEPRRLGQWHLTTCHRNAFPAKACVTRGTAYTACRGTSGYRSSIAVATSPAAPSVIAVEARSSTSSRVPGISRASAAQDNALETFRPGRPLRHAAA